MMDLAHGHPGHPPCSLFADARVATPDRYKLGEQETQNERSDTGHAVHV